MRALDLTYIVYSIYALHRKVKEVHRVCLLRLLVSAGDFPALCFDELRPILSTYLLRSLEPASLLMCLGWGKRKDKRDEVSGRF